ncbi:Fanconi anemia group D2 protein isoform X2 [Belonocnema kinseyi]|uniref:Fanconi anemia group D2 protein isoform X2 n=1 Tax=Belonocnema kinseyi TaxID=2817044 RepID=UPI00143D8891|nr:Fanconi anemia group D2 protein isoform X2 [Belonocnema kinseyi]
MDKRRIIRSKTGISGLRLLSTDSLPGESQISSKSDSFVGKNLTSKKKKSDPEQENLAQEHHGETSRAPSRLSDWGGSQASTKSRESNTSKLRRLTSRRKETQSNEIIVKVQKTPAKEPIQQNSILSLASNAKESDQLIIDENPPLESPQRSSVITESQSPRKRFLSLKTPSKDGGNESDVSLFSSGSSSAKKRGKLSFISPGNKNKNSEVNTDARSNASRRILSSQVGSQIMSPVRGGYLSTPREVNTNRNILLSSPICPTSRVFEFQTPQSVQSRNSFISFLKAAGVTLMEGENPHEINADPNAIRDRMKKILESKDSRHNKDDIMEEWKHFIDNEAYLRKAITNLKVVNNQTPFPSWFDTSLIKLLLRVSEIQKPLIQILLQKLNEVILEALEPENVAWTFKLLEQLRFLETVVDSDSMMTSIESLVECTPTWFQEKLIMILPDIVVDSQNHQTAEILVKLLEEKPEMTTVILESISTLSIGKEYFEELRIRVTNMLVTHDPFTVPAMLGFILRYCDEDRAAVKILKTMRMVHLEPLSESQVENCFKNQMLTVEKLWPIMKISKKVAHAAMTVVKNADADKADNDLGKPFDLILILLLISTGTTAKKSAETIFKQHLRSGYYRIRMLQTFYKDFLTVARVLQPMALTLASNLLRSDDRLYADFGIEWFISIFVSQEREIMQREVLRTMINQVGFNNLTAKNCFMILRKMIADKKNRKHLQAHCNHLKGLLEKVENLDLESVAIMSDVLHGLCSETSLTSESLQLDLFMLMDKQLSHLNSLIKCKGVLSAVMAIKHLSSNPETCQKAREIFEKVSAAVLRCPRSRALFYDRMSQVISDTRNLDQNFLQALKSNFEDILSQEYLNDITAYSDDLEAKFGLNNEYADVSTTVINFVKEGEEKFGGIVPILFRLLRMCTLRTSEDGSLEDINAILGTSLLVPKDLTSPEPHNLDYMIYCINWFREVISGFVKQSDSLMQRQVLKRLDNLMWLQGEFQMALSMCDTRYQPPQAYFHYFPPKPFIKVDRKSSKKGKKGAADKTQQSGTIPEWESFDLGSLLTSKNPTYFRRLDTKVAHLLDVKMDMTLTQTSSQAVSIAQVCFLVKELLGMLENDDTETLVYDLIQLLPQICNKLQDIVQELRANEIDDCQKREAVILLLRVINKIFSWKELFHSAKYNSLLKDGLRTLASQVRTSNSVLNSVQELSSESYKYFALLSDVAENRSIILAHTIVNVCETLMKHSKSFKADNMGKHAMMAYGFLKSDDWLDKQTGPAYRNAIAGLLKAWMDNEPSPLKSIRKVMEWLADDVELLDKPTDCLRNLPSINKNNFPLLFRKVLEGLIHGTKTELNNAKSDLEKIELWKDVGLKIKEIIKISKKLKTRTVLVISVRYLVILMRTFLSQGLLYLEHSLKTQMASVTETIKLFQASTRYLHTIYCQGMSKTDTVLAVHFPSIKALVEEFVCRVKAMMVLNNCLDCFSTGTLLRKDIDGHRIMSQSSAEDSGEVRLVSDETESGISEILQCDLDDDLGIDAIAAEENLEEEGPEEDNEDANLDSI